MKNNLIRAALILMGIVLSVSCVNEEYDIKKYKETEVTLLKNLSIPIGNLGMMKMQDLLQLEDAQGLIRESETGDYLIHIDGEPISESFRMPDFGLGMNSIQTEPVIVHFPSFPSLQSGLTITYSSVAGSELTTKMPVQIDSDLPDMIVDVRSVSLDSDVSIVFKTNQGAIHVKEGFTFQFPTDLSFSKADPSDGDFTLTNGSTLTFNKEVTVLSSEEYEINLKLNSITAPSGSFSNAHLSLDEEVGIIGDFYIITDEFASGASDLKLEMLVSVNSLSVKSAEIKVNIDEEIQGMTIDVPEIPDFLASDDVSFDFYNPTLSLRLENSAPVSFSVGAALKAYYGGKAEDITINPFGQNPSSRLDVQAGSVSEYLISKRPTAVLPSVVNIEVPGLGDIISNAFPEVVGIDDISIVSLETDYVTFRAEEEYGIMLDYEVNIPLSFGEDLAMSLTYDVDGLDFGEETKFGSALLSFDIINSIPLNFSMKAESLGSDDTGCRITVEGEVAAGSQLSPTSNKVLVTMESPDGLLAINGIRLRFEASTSAEHAGIALNKSQGLEIKNISLSLPDGITLEIPVDGE